MSKIKQLIKSYGSFISVPWKEDAAEAQRVIFCVYGENEELRLRSKIEEVDILAPLVTLALMLDSSGFPKIQQSI